VLCAHNRVELMMVKRIPESAESVVWIAVREIRMDVVIDLHGLDFAEV
jgi:hypothetical protein